MILIKQPLTGMTISQSKALFKKLKIDGRFRLRLLAADTMGEQMEIVAGEGFDCSKDEIRTVLAMFFDEREKDMYDNFSLWGNKIQGK